MNGLSPEDSQTEAHKLIEASRDILALTLDAQVWHVSSPVLLIDYLQVWIFRYRPRYF